MEGILRFFSDNVFFSSDDNPPKLQPALLEIVGTKIASVVPTSRGDLPKDTLDLGSRWVTPAFVNAHTHLAMSALRALGGRSAQAGNVIEELWFAIEQQLTADDIRAFARIGAYECLMTGTATVFEHYYEGEAIRLALKDTGLCGAVAPTLQDLSGPGVASFDEQLEFTESLNSDLTERAAGRVAMLGPHATDTVSKQAWTRILSSAERHNLPIHVHVAQSIEEVRRSYERFDCSPIERLQRCAVLDHQGNTLMVHLLFASDQDLRRLDPTRHYLAACPWSWAQYAFPARVHHWQKLGFTIVVGTDAGASNDTMNVQQELRLLAQASTLGLPFDPAYEAHLHTGTLASAEALAARRNTLHAVGAGPSLSAVWGAASTVHPHLKVGQIAPGFLANIAVWDQQHPAVWPGQDLKRALVHSDMQGALHSLMSAGRWIATGGNVSSQLMNTPAVVEHITEATERLEHLFKRCGIQ